MLMQMEFITNFDKPQAQPLDDYLLCQSCSMATARPEDWTWGCWSKGHSTVWKSEWDRDQEAGDYAIGEREPPQRGKPYPVHPG